MTATVLRELLKGDGRGERAKRMGWQKKEWMDDGQSGEGQGRRQGCGLNTSGKITLPERKEGMTKGGKRRYIFDWKIKVKGL